MEILVFLLAAYFAPTLIALLRGHHNTAAIFVLNLLLGWTVLGWIVSLVWSLTAVMRPAPIINWQQVGYGWRETPPRDRLNAILVVGSATAIAYWVLV